MYEMKKHFITVLVLILTIIISTQASYKINYVSEGVYSYETTTITKYIGECVTLSALSFFPENGTITTSWRKDTQPISSDNLGRIIASDRTLTIKSLRPSDHAYYQVTMDNKYSNVKEITDIWLHVKGCGKHQQELNPSSSTSCGSLCKDKCPSEWTYVVGTDSKCCQYFSKPQKWSIASEECQAIGGELTTINNAVENTFISDMLETGAGGWIGLNDRETEGKYVWNFKQTQTQTYYVWGEGEPSNNNNGCNIENCVSMRKSNGKWTDVVCGAFYSVVCQVSFKYNVTDNKGWSCLGDTCYKYFIDSLQWNDAVALCHRIHKTSHLVSITSQRTNDFLQNLIDSPIWIGLNDIREAGLYEWESSASPFSFSNWDFGEPNDLSYQPQQPKCSGEDCVQIKKFGGSITWHDLGCDTELPYICEKIRNRAFSTGQYVGMVIGTFVFLSMVFGIIHAAFQKHKRTAVKDIIKNAYQESVINKNDSGQQIVKGAKSGKFFFRSTTESFIPNRYQNLN